MAMEIRKALSDIFQNVQEQKKTLLKNVSPYLPRAPIVTFGLGTPYFRTIDINNLFWIDKIKKNKFFLAESKEQH